MEALKRFIKRYARLLGYEIRAIPAYLYRSETSKCRSRLAEFCKGNGLDIGPGGDPILASAVRVDLCHPYAYTGDYPVQLTGDGADLQWFRDETLDYVYSSHLLEDFPDTESVLREWIRVLRRGGVLVLFCPDEKAYREYCAAHGQRRNPHHRHADFSLFLVKDILLRIGQVDVIHECALTDAYSFELVAVRR